MRKASELTLFTMRIHKVGKYLYASTQRPKEESDDKNETEESSLDVKQPTKYAHVHWGTLDENLVFTPSRSFLYLPQDERDKFIFPKEWNLSKLTIKHDSEPGPLKEAVTIVEEEIILQYRTRFYGGVWLLEKIAEQLGVREDLMVVFNYNRVVVDTIMTIAMFMILTNYNLDRLEDWQDLEKYPTDYPLSPPRITEFEQTITEEQKMDLFKLRASRLGNDEILALDSTTKTSFNGKLIKVAWGKNKEGLDFPVTLEITLYAMSKHIPVYTKTVAGNMNDSRSIDIIIKEVKEAGFQNFILMMDRGYQSLKNIEKFIIDDIKAIICMKAGVSFSLQRIKSFKPYGFIPEGFVYSEILDLYVAQFDLVHTVKLSDNTVKVPDRLKLNLYFDPIRRAAILKKLYNIEQLKQPELDALISKAESLYSHEKEGLENEYDLYSFEWKTIKVPIKDCPEIKMDKEDHRRGPKRKFIKKYIPISYKLNQQALAESKISAGYRALITHKLDLSPEMAMLHYGLRNDQEVDHELWKSQLPCDRERNSSESASIGAGLIQFVSRIMRCDLRYQWSCNLEMRKKFRSTLAVIDTMRKIQCHEYPKQSQMVLDPFGKKQIEVCSFLGLDPPKGSTPTG